MKTKHQLRCFCSRSPLLAVYGLDDNQKLYLHIKIYKQDRIYGEVLVTDGTVKIHCRECLRWHRIVFVQPAIAKLVETDIPEEILPEIISLKNPFSEISPISKIL